MKKKIAAALVVGLMALAPVSSAFADSTGYEGQPGGQSSGGNHGGNGGYEGQPGNQSH